VSSKAIGSFWENKAAQFLVGAGLSIIARNVRYSGGEIDLIARDNRTLVFIEVKMLSDRQFGSAASRVHTRKQRRIIFAAQCFLSSRPALLQLPCRFDVLAWEPRDGQHEARWIKQAFEAPG